MMDQSSNAELDTPTETINFLHIPKTGGITFNNLLVNLFEEDEVYVSGVFQLIEKLRRGEKFDNSYIKYFRAHLHYAPYFFEKPVQYVTILRDPVKQVLSSIKQLMRAKGEPNHYAWKNINSFETLFTSRSYGSGYWNLQTRMVSGCLNFDQNPAIQYAGNRPFDDPIFLEKAIENLNRFAFFGITSRFNDSLDLLEYLLGWELIRTPRKNITPPFLEYEFSQDDLELINERNQLDQKLYDYAASQFSDTYSEMIKKIGKKTEEESPVVVESSNQIKKFETHDLTSSLRATQSFLDQQVQSWKKSSILEYNPYFGLNQKKLKKYLATYQFQEENQNPAHSDEISNVNPTSLMFDENSFDIIICLDTIDCVIDPEKVISELVRVLKVGGKIILSVPVKTFVRDNRSKRWRASEIEGRYQPLYPQKLRKSAIGTEMLIALEFSKDIKQAFGRWANQPVKVFDIPSQIEPKKLVVIQKKYSFKSGKYEEIRVRELEHLLETGNFSLPIRLDIYHEIALMQGKIIDALKADISKAKQTKNKE